MNLTHYVDDLQQRLAAAADAGGADAQQLAQRLTAPLDAAVRLVLLDALSEAAGEISAELAPGSVDVRLRGGAPEFVVAPPAGPEARIEPAGGVLAPASVEAEGVATTRTTLRLPDRLKSQVETAAARDGISVNAWLVRAVAAAVDPEAGRAATPAGAEGGRHNRHTGWVR